jgi:hypothetical protein
MKKLLLSSAIVLSAFITKGQTTATDFTAADCSSTSHNLFTELNSGKIIVLVWIEPCGGCISDAKAGYDAMHSFATSNPGKVAYWLVDDVGNTDCASLSSWASTNGIVPINITIFNNTGNVINEADYGGTGMPHVVVLGDTTHHIYYNQLSGSNDGPAITNAISNAIAGITAVEQFTRTGTELTLFPNPSNDKVALSFKLPDGVNEGALNLYDITGKLLRSDKLTGPSGYLQKDNSQLSSGTYFYSIAVNGITVSTQKMVIVK